MIDRVEQTFGEIEALVRTVRIYMDALAEIAAHETSNAPLRALTALQDASAFMEERIPNGRLEP